MTLAIQIEAVRKSYSQGLKGRFEALKGISFSVERGEAFGFVGQNGAGKSTTIKILTGALRPSSGDARLFGVAVDQHLARVGLGYVPENPYLYDYLTPLEILMMGARLHGVKVDNLERHCMYWLERFAIAHVANKRIRSFSKGMSQRTALAHAFVVQPRLLILDEPLSGLDPIGRKDVVDVMLEYKKQGGTLLFSSHVLHDVEKLADRFGLIHKGELRAVRTPAEILAGDTGDLLVRYRGPLPLAGAAPEAAGTWRLQLAQDTLWSTMRELETMNCQLISVTPLITLESAFVQFVEANTPSGGVEDRRAE